MDDLWEEIREAADDILAPICAASGRMLVEAPSVDAIADLHADGVVIPYSAFARLYEATNDMPESPAQPDKPAAPVSDAPQPAESEGLVDSTMWATAQKLARRMGGEFVLRTPQPTDTGEDAEVVRRKALEEAAAIAEQARFDGSAFRMREGIAHAIRALIDEGVTRPRLVKTEREG